MEKSTTIMQRYRIFHNVSFLLAHPVDNAAVH